MLDSTILLTKRVVQGGTLAACLAAGSLAVAGDAAADRPWGTDRHPRSRNLFAVVDAAGALVSGSGVSAVTHLSTGQYEVTFTRDVSTCAYLATTKNAHAQALQAYTAGGHIDAHGVYVETKNQGGGLTDGPFHLVVVCGSRGTGFAVVGYSADLVRSTPGTLLTPLGSGRYQVSFPHWINHGADACAYLGTVGDPASELVYNPAGVYTGSGPDGHTVYVETKNPGGGLQDGVPFHLAAICPDAPRTNVAVLAANGFLDRGSIFTASFRSATGSYALVTTRDITGCATVATRGSVDQAVPFTPATVEIVPGPAANAVGFDVRNLLFFGGAPLDEALHTAVVCR